MLPNKAINLSVFIGFLSVFYWFIGFFSFALISKKTQKNTKKYPKTIGFSPKPKYRVNNQANQ